MYALKELMSALRVTNIDARQDGAAFDPKWGRASYLFNATIAGIERADALLIVGSNPRREAAVLNARIRKRWRAGNFPIALIGEKADLTYPYEYLGAGAESLAKFGGNDSAKAFDKAERPLMILGASVFARPDGAAVAAHAAKLAGEFGFMSKDWNGFSRAAHRGVAGRRARSRLRAGEGRPQGRRHGAAGHARRPVPARRR